MPATPRDDLPKAAPQWLGKFGAIEYRRIVPILRQMGVIGAGDRLAVERYCRSYHMMRVFAADIDENGVRVESDRGGMVRNPAIAAYSQAETAHEKAAIQLGLTPSARRRVEKLPAEQKGHAEWWRDAK